MKTTDKIGRFFPVAILSLALVASTIGASAQERHNEGRRGNDHKQSKKEYRTSDRNEKRISQNDKRYGGERNYQRQNWNSHSERSEYRPQYSGNYNRGNRDYYNHPQYGRVYQRFDHNPIVFNHDRDNYYYYGNHFYNYRRGIGYCMIDPPRNIYFRDLPFDCDRIDLNGEVFFRNGDLFFQLSPRGYVIVPSPIGISISARF